MSGTVEWLIVAIVCAVIVPIICGFFRMLIELWAFVIDDAMVAFYKVQDRFKGGQR